MSGKNDVRHNRRSRHNCKRSTLSSPITFDSSFEVFADLLVLVQVPNYAPPVATFYVNLACAIKARLVYVRLSYLLWYFTSDQPRQRSVSKPLFMAYKSDLLADVNESENKNSFVVNELV